MLSAKPNKNFWIEQNNERQKLKVKDYSALEIVVEEAHIALMDDLVEISMLNIDLKWLPLVD